MQTKIIRFSELGSPDVLKLIEESVPALKADEALVLHEAIGVNYIDTYYRTGLYPGTLPSSLGTEAAGTVIEVGTAVHTVKAGDRVAYAQGSLGSYSEKRVVPARFLVKLPDGISSEAAAGGLLKGLTVQYLFRQTHELKAGDTILFHAAAGGVGLIACQWARQLGVNLIGTVSSEEKAKLAIAHGASHTINYTKENVAEKVAEYTGGKKVPVVYDGVGKSTWEASLDSLSPRGLLVSFGNASGAVTNVSLGILATKGSLYVTRPTLGSYFDTPGKLEAGAGELFKLIESEAIQIQISKRFPLKDAGLAHAHIESHGSTGSTILIP